MQCAAQKFLWNARMLSRKLAMQEMHANVLTYLLTAASIVSLGMLAQVWSCTGREVGSALMQETLLRREAGDVQS